jgi:hypothetical protein
LVILLITIPGFSQNKFGFFAGPQMTSASYTARSVKQETSYKTGFQAGVCLKVPFDIKISFVPTAFYSMKGYKVTYTQFLFPPDPAAIDNNTLIHTFELGALLQYDFNEMPSHIFIKAGPTLDFQLFGNEKYHTMSNELVDRNMKFSFGDYGHFSANMLLQLGYETKNGFMIFGQYSHGLANINNADEGPSIRHRVFGISIGKYLARKK